MPELRGEAAMNAHAAKAKEDANTLRKFLRDGLDASLAGAAPTDRNVKELWQHWNSYTLRVIRKLDRIDAPSIVETASRPTEKEIEA